MSVQLKVIGVILSLLLVSTISAMLLAGLRALYVIGETFCVSLARSGESIFGASQCRGFADHAYVAADCDVNLRLYYFLWRDLGAEFLVTVLGVWVLRMRHRFTETV